MSKPITAVSASTPPSSGVPTSESQWGFRTVVVLIGVGALGLLVFAIFRRYRPEPNEQMPPSPRRELKFCDRPHSSELLYLGKPCLNEVEIPRFDYYAEGFFTLKLAALFPEVIADKAAKISVQYRHNDKRFFSHQETTSDLHSPLQLFLPNLPFNDIIILTIQIKQEKNEKALTITQSVSKERGFYSITRLSDVDGCDPQPLSAQPTPLTHQLPRPLSINLFSCFSISLKSDDQFEIQTDTILTFHTIRSKGCPTLAYLKIVAEDIGVAIVLPFFDKKGTLLFSPAELINRWKDAYLQATGQEAPSDLNLSLHEIKLYLYHEPITSTLDDDASTLDHEEDEYATYPYVEDFD